MNDDILDRVAFTREMLGIDVFDHQAEALRSDCPVIAIRGGRRSGKSFAAQAWALHTVVTRRDAEVIVITPNESRGRVSIEEFEDLIRGTPLEADAMVEAHRITFRSNGSRIVSLAPTAGNIRGRGRRVFGALIDDAGHVPAGIWRDLRYVLLDHHREGAQAWIVGSPWSGAGHFFHDAYARGEAGDSDYFTATWPTSLNPTIDADWIERERARMNIAEARAELDGEQPDSAQFFFGPDLLDSCTVDVTLPAMGDDWRPAGAVLGADFGLVDSQSAVTRMWRVPMRGLNPRHSVPTFIAASHAYPLGTGLVDVADDIASRPCVSYYALERNAIGEMPSEAIHRQVQRNFPRPEHARRWTFIYTTRELKMKCYAQIRWLLENRQLLLPRDVEQRRALAGVRVEVAPTGARIGSDDPAVKDDIADSIAFCAMPFTRERGRQIACALSELADPARAPADADVPTLDEPVVTSDGELSLYARTPLQGAGDRRLYIPPGVRPLDPRAVEHARRLDEAREHLSKGMTNAAS